MRRHGAAAAPGAHGVTLAVAGPHGQTAGMKSPLLACLALVALTTVSLARSTVASPPSQYVPLPKDPSDSTVTILLVRHAEKDLKVLGSDPPLSAVGMLRAQELARVLADARIDAIYVTPYQRNRQTAQPLATLLGDTLTVVNPIDETVDRLRSRHWGQTVLAVGHSNTIPQIVEKLTGQHIRDFSEGEYDRLVIVTMTARRPARVVALRYGTSKAP